MEIFKREVKGDALRDEVNKRLGTNYVTQYVLEIKRGAKQSADVKAVIDDILAEAEQESRKNG